MRIVVNVGDKNFKRHFVNVQEKVMIFIAMGNLKSAKLIAKFPDAKEAERGVR
jgi:hypothetical protein